MRRMLLPACLLLLSSSAALGQEAGRYPPDMADRVQACTPCHGAAGKGTNDAYFPRLAGKPAGYLFNQLEAFKSGRRKYPPMNYLLAFLTDDYLRQFAEYFADQRPALPERPPTEASKPVLDHGHVLVTQGDLDRAIPACVSCHGGSLTGQSPAIPGLLGLRASYISAQLGGWRYGTRTAAAPDCMQLVAGRLTEDDVRAVAAYLANLPQPADPAPSAAGSYSLPFGCGSQPGGAKP
ncbi:c-type cytochrome [Rhizobium hidalgonense]|uniref:c-type cytochrome n=1 Tax=Rhizobium hidalgonense TaxID=1538159 RepID=UPI0028724B22|nr:c-type cytochrome [Rhizobium hidalgonense]MDR9808472.1 c-type cytochrome [Rhizobium hidalgonense]